MRIWSLGSGSRGNAIVVEAGGRALLVDCAFGPRALPSRLRQIGLVPEQIDALVLTHEHQDHADGAERAVQKWRWPVYASAGTLAALRGIPAKARRVVAAGVAVTVGDFEVEGLAIPHDAAAPLAFTVTATASGARAGIAHDVGAVPDALPDAFARCDALCIEANHDVAMLRDGPYPPALQARIRGGRGHLSNAKAATLLAGLVHPGLRAVALLHLSETNNAPALAAATVDAALRRAGARCRARPAAGRSPDALAALGGPAPRQLALAL